MWISDPDTTLELARTAHRERIDEAVRHRAAISAAVHTTLRDRIAATLHRSAPLRHRRRLGHVRTAPCVPASAHSMQAGLSVGTCA
jgi:hypothetical protein